ncbi:hypothetical protein EJ08DRAFT_19327 [Tothia fuscella]|uniref:HMG box domain-containing protein n=1 Tax=Tothia fuscella TaxID=1048955 RepID=A0A9P4NZ73_9PEZI|nr:hypothetical protein EJ08DRAFT_19327 [Tothia fuscella]
MSHSVVSIPNPIPDKPSGVVKDVDPSPALARLRSNKQYESQSQRSAGVSAQRPHLSQPDSSPLDDFQAVDSAPARMTRKRVAHLANLEDAALHKSIAQVSRNPAENTESPGGGPISSICLCQPDPKIPRPRNAFILYRQRHQQNIIAQHPGLPNPEISKIAGELWRAEPDEVKNEWKSLAEEEKNRHAQQYPDYRFQPRHKNKTSPTSTTADKLRCNKCGGRSIISTSSPFASPSGLTPRKPALFTPSGISPLTPSSNNSTNTSPRQLPALQGLNIATPRSNPQQIAAQMGTRYAGENNDDMDAKRRRYNGYNPNNPRPKLGRPMTGGLPPPSAYQYPPPPLGFDIRRGSLPPPPGLPYHTPRNSIRKLSISPPDDQIHPAIVAMGPPPPPRGYAIGRNGLHGYPHTPITAQSHGLPVMTHSRQNSESLRLPPLRSPGVGDQSRSVEAMVKSIPYFGKLKVLRCIAPPLKEPSLASPSPSRIRGSIISVEGDDKADVDGVLQHLSESLKRSDEFEVRILTGPKEPRGRVGFKDFFLEVATWHEKAREMIDFITAADSSDEGSVATNQRTSISSSQKGPNETDKMMMDEDEPEEGEIVETVERSQEDQQRAKELERKKEEMNQSIERESEKRRKSEQFEKDRKIPLLLISNYILHASDAWACSLPIGDGYSPADHWQWVATLWRGVVGADHTVYVKSTDKEEPVSAISAESQWPTGKPSVEIKEEIGGLVVRKDKDKIEEGAMRRMAFEVGEWVRAAAANAAQGI